MPLSDESPPYTSPPTDIPQELIAAITDYLEEDLCTKDLINLSLTSRGFRSESQRALFRSPNLKGKLRDANALTKRLERRTHHIFLTAIENEPKRLGSYVQAYASVFLTYPPETGSQDIPEGLHNRPYFLEGIALWNLTCAVLPLLVNLRHLAFGSLALPMSECKFEPVAVLRYCTFPMLQSFAWLTSTDIIPLAAEFLHRHPHLRSFTLRSRPFTDDDKLRAGELPQNLLPNLEILHAPWNVLAKLLPHRTVPCVTWYRFSDLQYISGSLASHLAAALRGTRHLSLDDRALPDDALSNVSSLEVLCLISRGTNESFPLKALQKLRRLRMIIFHRPRGFIVHPADEPGRWARETIPKVQEAFEICPSLERVYFGIPGRGYGCMQRDTTGGVYVGALEDLSAMQEHFAPWLPPTVRSIEDVLDFYLC